MKWLIRFLLVFILVAIGSAVAVSLFDIELGTVDYWSRHGFWLLVGLALFPRLTLLLSSIATGGVFWWLGWVFAPRILIAILATIGYFETNPVLVVLAWLCACGGEAGEKHFVQRQTFRRGRGARELGIDEDQVIDV